MSKYEIEALGTAVDGIIQVPAGGTYYPLSEPLPPGDPQTECHEEYLANGPPIKLPEFKYKKWKLYVKWCSDKYYLKVCYPKDVKQEIKDAYKECWIAGIAVALPFLYAGQGVLALEAFSETFTGCLRIQGIKLGLDLGQDVTFTIFKNGTDCDWHKV